MSSRTPAILPALILGLAIACATAGCVDVGRAASPPAAGNPTSPASTPTSAPRDATAPPPGSANDSKGAPVIDRKGAPPRAERAVAARAAFTKPAVYDDGVRITVSRFDTGKVTSTGIGLMTGSPYLVFTITVANHGAAKLDLSGVVVSLRYGADSTTAAPLYDDVVVHDFSGTLAAGDSRSARYAFLVPKNVGKAVLYVDTDGTRLPATFSGAVPE